MTDTDPVPLLDRFTFAARAAVRPLSTRLWTHAGVAAALFATAPRRRALTIARSLGVHVSGSVILAAAVAMMLWNDFGPGPLDMFIVAVADHTGLPLALALWLIIGSMLMVAWALGRKPGVGSIATPIVIGPAIQFFVSVFDRFDGPSNIAAHVAVQLVAIVLIGIGAGAIVASGLGAGMGELLAQAASERTGQPQQLVRIGCELTWLIAGLLLSGPFGFGTLMMAVAIGPAVAHGYRAVDLSIVTATATARRQIRAHRPESAQLGLPALLPVAA